MTAKTDAALRRRLPALAAVAATTLGLLGCFGGDDEPSAAVPGPDRPAIAQGRDVFRYETFGNEGFWTDAMQLPQGLAKAGLTPLQALALGLNVDAEALSPATAKALTDALSDIRNGKDPQQTVLSNPAVTLTLINEGAVIGVVPVDAKGQRKPLGSSSQYNANDRLDLARGDKIGISCALCHSRTDNSVVPAGFAGLAGSVGRRVDGPNAIDLDVGKILAAADNPVAYLPLLQLALRSLNGATVGKTDFAGIQNDTNEEARAYLAGADRQGQRHYSPGVFDALPDGINNTAYTQAFFRTDLAAPWGHSGTFANLDDFNNYVYTVALDPTVLATERGAQLLTTLAGPVGQEIHQRYRTVLERAGLAGRYPFVRAQPTGRPVGDLTGVAGVRVDQAKLAALRAYTDQLAAPRTQRQLDPALVQRGQQVFGQQCASCHTADPNRPVQTALQPLSTLYPAYRPQVLLNRPAPLSPVQKSSDQGPSPSYDNEVVVVNASLRGEKVGYAQPLLLGLDGRKDFLHDGSVEGRDTLEALRLLMDPQRGNQAPHPFYIGSSADRDAVVQYLLSR